MSLWCCVLWCCVIIMLCGNVSLVCFSTLFVSAEFLITVLVTVML